MSDELVQQQEETVAKNGSTAAATAHDDFDWSVDRRNVVSYSEADRKKYDEVYSGTLKTIENNEIVKGTVVAVTATDVVLNIGFKSMSLFKTIKKTFKAQLKNHSPKRK